MGMNMYICTLGFVVVSEVVLRLDHSSCSHILFIGQKKWRKGQSLTEVCRNVPVDVFHLDGLDIKVETLIK